MQIIKTENISKIFKTSFKKKNIQALDSVSIQVPKGIIFGLLGPNGAGKTTLVKILLGISLATSGKAEMFGEPVGTNPVKRKIGYLPENHRFPLFLTGKEFLFHFGSFSGMEKLIIKERTEYLLSLVGLKEWSNKKLKTYSKGMLQRIGLAQALINDPELIFLDEPTDGVDPIGRKEIRDVLIKLKEEGKTIFLNSHLLSEVEMITDRIAILNKGKLIKEGAVSELKKKGEEYNFILSSEIENKISSFLIEKYSMIKKSDNKYSVLIQSDEDLSLLQEEIRKSGIIIKEMTQKNETLEDVFFDLIKNSKEEN